MTADGSVENGGFLHVSGLRYTINTAIPSTVQQDDKGVWTGGPTGAYRVTNVEVLNNETGAYEPLDLTAQYNLAGYNYTLRDLGDGFAMFDGAVNVLDYVSEDYMVLANYVESFPVDEATGLPTIPADSQYAEVTGNGRITIVNEPVAEEPVETTGYTDVSEANWYYEAVTCVTENSLMAGETETTFAPAAAVTGEALTAALNAVSSAEAAADGETVTREALAVLLWTRAGSPEAETDLSAFADADTVSAENQTAVAWAVAQACSRATPTALWIWTASSPGLRPPLWSCACTRPPPPRRLPLRRPPRPRLPDVYMGRCPIQAVKKSCQTFFAA